MFLQTFEKKDCFVQKSTVPVEHSPQSPINLDKCSFHFTPCPPLTIPPFRYAALDNDAKKRKPNSSIMKRVFYASSGFSHKILNILLDLHISIETFTVLVFY